MGNQVARITEDMIIEPAVIFHFLQAVFGEAPWVSEIMLVRKLTGPGLASITSDSYVSFPLVVTAIFSNSTFYRLL